MRIKSSFPIVFVISHDIVVYLFAINKYTNIEVYIYMHINKLPTHF